MEWDLTPRTKNWTVKQYLIFVRMWHLYVVRKVCRMCENLLLEQLGFSIKKERKKRVADNVDRSGQMSRFPQRSTQIYLSI